MSRQVKITVDALGRPKIEAVGFNGQGCGQATAAIEAALAGGEGGVERVMKPEWHNNDDTTQDQQTHMTW